VVVLLIIVSALHDTCKTSNDALTSNIQRKMHAIRSGWISPAVSWIIFDPFGTNMGNQHSIECVTLNLSKYASSI
jgi:hypothetical protein